MEDTAPREQPRVLVVDDDAAMRLLACESMQRSGFVVVEAEDGNTALSAFERLRPDIVLLDVMMPKMDGFATCAALRRLPGGVHTPVLMMTGLDDLESINHAYEVGATDFITKPINYSILNHRVRYMLRASKAQEALAEQAIRDTLTGLYNRRYFSLRMEEEISRAERNGHSLAILLCDLDHFKTINDTLGHQVGDEALKAVAKNIQEATRGMDLVFRWGGDEIVVVLLNTTREGILIVAERILKGVHKFGEKSLISLDLSIGIAIYPEHGANADELIRIADRSLYIAKKGGDKIHIGAQEYHLGDHSINVVFQPVMDVQSNQVLGYEALSRDPQRKLSILELFKRYQAIGKLNELKCICFKKQLRLAQEARLKKLFINVDFNVLTQVELIPKPAGMDVVLEISEKDALHDVESLLQTAKKWRAQGYKFAIDDFGAGFISLPFIAQLIPEYIKMDRSAILQAVSSQQFRGFLKDLIQALRNYSKEGIIAEGVETVKELETVKDLGVYLVQGFLLGRPKELK
jgi:diguanylate cyclase (GGDEF)-like protein